MFKATATELNKHPGKYIDRAMREPVILERSGHPVVVMVSYERYLQFEDAYWGELAIESDKERSIGVQETERFLRTD